MEREERLLFTVQQYYCDTYAEEQALEESFTIQAKDAAMRTIRSFCALILLVTGSSIAQEAPGPEGKALLENASELDSRGRTEEALELLDKGLETFTDPDYDRYFALNLKFFILTRLERFDEALPPAVEKANIIRSPKQALNVAKAYLRTGQREKALTWIEESAARGLQSYDIFDDAELSVLRDEERSKAVLERIRRNNGIGLPAPSFDRIDLSGNPVSLGNFRGKVLLVDFWATWCAPCIGQMPHLVKAYEAFHAKGFEIVGFAADQNRTKLLSYMTKTGVTWPNVLASDVDGDETLVAYRVANIPASFLIDRSGILREVNLTGEDLKGAIARLVDEER